MKIYCSDHLLVPLPPGHRFPMPKYALLHQRLCEARLAGVELLPAEPATDEQLLLVHHREYLDRIIRGR